MLTYFCPNCWTTLASEELICPRCHFDLHQYTALPYEKKLILGLGHPIASSRVIAIETLGELHSKKALSPFDQILEDEKEDFYTQAAVIEALMKIDTREARQMLRNAARRHRSALVRRAAQGALDKPALSGANGDTAKV